MVRELSLKFRALGGSVAAGQAKEDLLFPNSRAPQQFFPDKSVAPPPNLPRNRTDARGKAQVGGGGVAQCGGGRERERGNLHRRRRPLIIHFAKGGQGGDHRRTEKQGRDPSHEKRRQRFRSGRPLRCD